MFVSQGFFHVCVCAIMIYMFVCLHDLYVFVSYNFRFTLYFMYSNWFNGMFIKDIYLYVSVSYNCTELPSRIQVRYFHISFIF